MTMVRFRFPLTDDLIIQLKPVNVVNLSANKVMCRLHSTEACVAAAPNKTSRSVGLWFDLLQPMHTELN